jgi:hypothetical protein
VDPNPNPGGPKTCGSGGSGSGTLIYRYMGNFKNMSFAAAENTEVPRIFTIWALEFFTPSKIQVYI